MSRKKHTHQTKAEMHADEAAVAATVVETGEAKAETGAGEATAKTEEVQGRLKKLVKTAEELAKTRLSGTRVELLIDGLPERLEKALDAALDRVGLVRKSKLPGAVKATATAETSASTAAEPAPAE